MYVDTVIFELEEKHGIKLDVIQKSKLQLAFANYAFAACIDSTIRKEAELICVERANELGGENDRPVG